ncbi:PAS domain-containing protein [Nonomuraea sp. NPDC048916]|uniref:helix-turn-helix transcriptional regulator n=1 Tax=Nonomuraea sp. NPDC048916 TaxID=3154232 RepID=UPI0034069097
MTAPQHVNVFATAKVIAEGIGAMFGEDCEVAVHDLRNPTHSLIHLVNGHVSGRQLGHPIRDLIYKVLPNIGDQNVLANYSTPLADGRVLKSTTCLIRDENGDPLIAVCINYDVGQLQTLAGRLNAFLGIADVESRPEGGGAPLGEAEVLNMLQVLVRNTVKEFGRNPKKLSREERLRAIDFLEGKGAFLVKGAVPMVAECFGISEPTVYRYIDQVRSTR